MDREERRIVIDLLKEGDNTKTIRKIIDNYPNLGNEEYVKRYTCIVADVLSEDQSKLTLIKHPGRGNVKELKIEVPKWNGAGLPFTLMLCKDQNAVVRVLLSCEAYDQHTDSLKEFSKSSNGIVGDFPKLVGWSYWHSVLASDGNQAEVHETIIDVEIFEDTFWKQVEEKLRSQLKPLLPLMDAWLTRKLPG